nr:immunoglobulin heavy chain junction region [Macaca mulatta]
CAKEGGWPAYGNNRFDVW